MTHATQNDLVLAVGRALAHTISGRNPISRVYWEVGRQRWRSATHPSLGAGCVESLCSVALFIYFLVPLGTGCRYWFAGLTFPGSPGVNMYETYETEDEQFDDPAPCEAGPVTMDLESDDDAEDPWPMNPLSAWDDDRAHVEASNITWPDDPLRLYLNQIGKISLLSHKEEVALARQVELSRRRFRRELLQVAFILNSAVRTLERVHQKELPFDRTIQVSVSDALGEAPDHGPLPSQLADTAGAVAARTPRTTVWPWPAARTKPQRRDAWKRLIRRRCRATRLVEELGLRMEHFEAIYPRFERVAKRVAALSQLMEQAADNGDAELAKHRSRTAAVAPHDASYAAMDFRSVGRACAMRWPAIKRPRRDCPRATCDWSSRSSRSIAIAVSASWI